MDEFAKSIGWWVIVIAIIYVVGKVVISMGDESERKRNDILHIGDIELRLAYRMIYRSTTDPAIHELVKDRYTDWFFLDLDLNDEEYRKKMLGGASSQNYQQAVKNTEKRGYAVRLLDGKLASRSTRIDAA
jgi:hypothetical protein